MKFSLTVNYLFLASIIATFISCGDRLPVKNEVVIHELSDPEMLNPLNSVDASSGYITSYMFQRLIDADFFNPPEYVPVLAESRPTIETTDDNRMKITFKIRKEAKWDNGNPITAKDIEFSIKTMINPLVNNPHAKPYFAFINDFVFYPEDPLRFTVCTKEIYFMAEAIFSDLHILPDYLYDPKGLMSKFTVKQIAENSESLKSDPQIKEFADDFNSEKRMRNPEFIGGSGPYKFTEWKTNERVTLTLKENWWGKPLEKENCYFQAHPQKLIFQTIKDQTTALVSLKAGNLDVMRSIRAKDFAELSNSEKYVKNFNSHTPMEFSYVYIGLNHKSPLLADKHTRQALAHVLNVEEVIRTVKYGKAERIVGPIHPSKKRSYNSNLSPYSCDPEKAKQLLEIAGWKDSNGDGTVDRSINGKNTEFKIDFIVNSGNDERKSIALMFQEQAKKVGISVNVMVLDWAVYLEKCTKHDFELMIGKWVSSPSPDDYKQTFHSSSCAEGGSNFSNFTNARADSLIDLIRYEINEEKRNALYKEIQVIFHEELPMIFLYTPTEHIAIHKKFDNAEPSVIRPGYWPPGFILKEAGSN